MFSVNNLARLAFVFIQYAVRPTVIKAVFVIDLSFKRDFVNV